MNGMFLILDFGSQYTHLIKASLAKLGFRSQIVPGDIRYEEWKALTLYDLDGIILSGGAASVYDGTIDFDKTWLNLSKPVLGICYGHQLIANLHGAVVEKGQSEYGVAKLNILKKDLLLENVPINSTVWMSHSDNITHLPSDFIILASSDYSDIAIYKNIDSKMYGVLFHPEVSHSEFGALVLENFCEKICKVQKGNSWNASKFIENTLEEVKQIVKDSKVVIGLSGGVDSLTTSVLLRKALEKDQLLAVYVETGLMPTITKFQVEEFCKEQDISLLVADRSEEFFEILKGITDPTDKGMAIGKKFINVFEEIAKEYKADIFAQGTIWSDVVESGVTKFSSKIKPHHNVGGLPEKMDFKLLEPLRDLFKDQVRLVATELQLPEWVIKKKVFPGPGFAIRVQDEVTPEKVEIVRKATEIIEEIIYGSVVADDIWMAFGILIDVPSLGVKGDKRTENKHALVVRIIESKNSMTVEFSQKAFPYLAEISKRLVDEVEIGRVVYDITNKPPATIEWQ